MATCYAPLSLPAATEFGNEQQKGKYTGGPSSQLKAEFKTPKLGIQYKLPTPTVTRNYRTNRSIRAEYRDGNSGGGGGGGGGGDFFAGFLVGGAVFGTLAYIFAPQIRRSLLNEDEYGFRRARRPIYYDEGLERTRQTLNEKISQLNSAIDNVSSRLRGGNTVAVETDPEVEATM